MRSLIQPVLGGTEVSWESQYQTFLAGGRKISPGALQELLRCTDRAFARFAPLAIPDTLEAGAIVGAVQSGKTGLMMNLAARALDRGFRVVVVLAGLKDDLRTQTALRFTRDLLQRGDQIHGAAGGFTHPLGEGYHGKRRDCWAPRFDEDVNHDQAFVYMLNSSLRRGLSVLAVAKKNVTTLNRLREAYEGAVAQFGTVPLMVLDDECDEASVSDDPDAPTPDRVARLWLGLAQHVSYIGLTATPAANLLQDTASVLYPRDFVLTMRSPGDRDSILSFVEPSPSSRYTGGAVFYEMLEEHGRANFLVRTQMSDNEFNEVPGADAELEEALMAYFVSGAMRLRIQDGVSLEDSTRPPLPHTMLAHTESRVESHWNLCARLVGVTRRKAGKPAEIRENLRRIPPQARLDPGDLVLWLDNEEVTWRAWHESFRASRSDLLQIMPDREFPPLPSWDEVRELLPLVFRAVKLRVVNSDDSAIDESLQFHPSYSAGGMKAPTDIYSIIIGGNRLSRGLTIEGLCTAYYTRDAAQLLEDTTVQRERWFGYRGSHLEYCRLFTHRALAMPLRRFNEHDEDLRRQLAWNIAHGRRPVDATYRFLTIRNSLPTAKTGRGKPPDEIDISGARLFVDRVQVGTSSIDQRAAELNQRHASALCRRIAAHGKIIISGGGESLGCMLPGQAADEVAKILDGWTYTFHNPDPSRGVGWNLMEFYRPPWPDAAVTGAGMPPRSDPFLFAAYLRFWQDAFDQCETDARNNRFRAADSISPWVLCPCPVFNIAIRYGSLPPRPGSLFDFDLLNRAVDPSGRVGSRWGGRGYGSFGDEWIDMSPINGDPEAPRPSGSPGLLLLHVIARDAQGRDGSGEKYEFERPCVGLVVPSGGPCIRFVLAEDEP